MKGSTIKLRHLIILAAVIGTVHFAAIPLGLYEGRVWIDMPLHFLAGVLFAFLWLLAAQEKITSKVLLSLSAISFSALASVLWEGYEFVLLTLFPEIAFQFKMYSPTLGEGLRDISFGLLGGIVGALFIVPKAGGEKGNVREQEQHYPVEQRPKVGLGVMIIKSGKVLLGKRRSSHGAGEWAWPGGHLEYMESYEGCVRREVREETGMEVKSVRFLRLYNLKEYAPKHYVDLGFTAEWTSGEPRVLEPEKCERWEWFDMDKLPKPLFATVPSFIEAYKTGCNFFDA